MEELLMTVLVFIGLCLIKQEQEVSKEVSNEAVSPEEEVTTNIDLADVNSESVEDLLNPPLEVIPSDEEVEQEEVKERADINELSIRNARKLASCYGIKQKANGKDKPLALLKQEIMHYLTQNSYSFG